MTLTRLVVGLEPLNVLGTGIVRPDPHRFRAGNSVAPSDRPLADSFSETKEFSNAQYLSQTARIKLRRGFTPTEVPSTRGTRVFDKPSPKRRWRLIMDSRFICAVCFDRACEGDVLRVTVYRDDQWRS